MTAAGDRSGDAATDHPQKRIRSGGLRARVDAGIAPLVLAIWRAGHATTFSCQARADRDGQAWLVFRATDGLNFLIGSAEAYGDPDLVRRIKGNGEGGWRYGVFHGCEAQEYLRAHDGALDVLALREVFFPPSDIAILVDAVRRAHERRMK